MRELSEIRKDIDVLDNKLLDLFLKRQALSQEVAEYKYIHGMSVFDASREQEKLHEIQNLPKDCQEFLCALMNLSKSLQQDYIDKQ